MLGLSKKAIRTFQILISLIFLSFYFQNCSKFVTQKNAFSIDDLTFTPGDPSNPNNPNPNPNPNPNVPSMPGDIVITDPDGTVVVTSPDGTITRTAPDGTIVVTAPDGTVTLPPVSSKGKLCTADPQTPGKFIDIPSNCVANPDTSSTDSLIVVNPTCKYDSVKKKHFQPIPKDDPCMDPEENIECNPVECAVAACQVEACDVAETASMVVSDQAPVDILFLIDPSGSMEYEQSQLGKRLTNFIASLGTLDWRIAIASMSPVPGDYVGSDGKLAPILNSDPGLFFIDSNTPNAEQAFLTTIASTERTPGDGRGQRDDANEQGIVQAHRVLDRRAEYGFLRDQAFFHTVMLSDENERSDGKNLGPKDMPQSLIDRIANEPVSGFSSHSIITIPGDTVCEKDEGTENHGTFYQELSMLTNGVVGSVCATDYTPILSNIGEAIIQGTRILQLPCAPKDGAIKHITYDPPLANPASYTITGDQLEFIDLIPAGTKVTVGLVCAAP